MYNVSSQRIFYFESSESTSKTMGWSSKGWPASIDPGNGEIDKTFTLAISLSSTCFYRMQRGEFVGYSECLRSLSRTVCAALAICEIEHVRFFRHIHTTQPSTINVYFRAH